MVCVCFLLIGNAGGEEPVRYVHSPCGLFPLPLGRNAKVGHVSKVRSRFKLLGKFVAKALMDSRMLDLPLSLAMYKWMLGQEGSLSLADMESIDPGLAQSLRQLHQVVFILLLDPNHFVRCAD